MHFVSHKGLSWCTWDLLEYVVSVGVKFACDCSNRLIDEFSPIDLNYLSCVVCVSICESTDLCRGLFLLLLGQTVCRASVCLLLLSPFFSVPLLWLVLCQLVATVIGYSREGHDPADGSIVCVLTCHSFTHWCSKIAVNTYPHLLASCSRLMSLYLNKRTQTNA